MKRVTRDQKGRLRKVFCCCNDTWEGKSTNPQVQLGLSLGSCPICGYRPWIYIKKTDEPSKAKQEAFSRKRQQFSKRYSPFLRERTSP